jgi:hypothetical protein
MRAKAIKNLRESVEDIGHEPFLTALLDTMSLQQIGRLQVLADQLSPARKLLGDITDQLIKFGVLPNEASECVDIAMARVGIKDVSKFMWTCFAVNNERKQSRENEDKREQKPE